MSQQPKIKMLLYCHNVTGLGHIVRSARIAGAAAARPGCECCVITGCRFLDRIRIDARVRVVALPPVQLTDGIRFAPVNDDGGGDGDGDIMEQRGRQIEEFAREWSPDVMLVDHNATGLGGELIPALLAARREGWPTRFVWGLRDIQVAPTVAARATGRPRNPRIRAALECYRGAIAYSDAGWVDTFASYRDYGLPPRREYVGVVAARPLPATETDVPVVVGLTGGGAGGERLFRMLLEACLPLLKAKRVRLRFLAGPFAPAEALKEAAGVCGEVEVWPTGSVEEAIQDAALVVSRAGYNTAYTLAQTSLPLVLVPYPDPGAEQSYRAGLLARLPNISVVEEQSHGAAALLAERIVRGLSAPRVARELPFRVDGAERAAEWLTRLAAEEVTFEASDYQRR
jgi:predicted glycosyltransferase